MGKTISTIGISKTNSRYTVVMFLIDEVRFSEQKQQQDAVRFDVLEQEENVATIDDDVEPGYTIMLRGTEGSQILYTSIMEVHGMDITFNTAKILVLPVLLVVILGMASVNVAAHRACWKPIGGDFYGLLN
ncbi:hypothetical protein Tco_0013933 [Tanacetum coccineum]